VKADASKREVRDGTLGVRISAEDSSTTVVVVGEMDMANAATLATELERVEDENPESIVVDMSELEFIDSTGIAVLVAAHRRLNAEAELMRFVRSRAIGVQRVMEVTGLERELPFLP
jgi:anti-anti-sigma factor